MGELGPLFLGLGLGALLVGAAMLTVGLRATRRTAARRRAWVQVTGVVTRAPGFLQPYADVTYPLPDGRPAVHRSRRNQQEQLRLGQQVPLLVDPADPRHGVERVGLAQTVTALVLPLVGSLLALGGLGLLGAAAMT
ncbi:MAG: hypothetical protein JWN17_2659 [Frankiales bacterium]|nr:hypothetical protein [Frankiales bacterium]